MGTRSLSALKRSEPPDVGCYQRWVGFPLFPTLALAILLSSGPATLVIAQTTTPAPVPARKPVPVTPAPAPTTAPEPTRIITPTSKPEFASASDLTLLQCGNLIYAGNQSSVCFADRFLSDAAQQTNLRVNKRFCPVRLDADALFDFPFCVMSGNQGFAFSDKERKQLKKYLTQGGFLLVSPGCSDQNWDRAFRQEIKVCFPEHALNPIPMTHPIFSLVNVIPRLTEKHGKPAVLEGLEINGRLVLVYSKEGLNDVEHAKGCCCCGGNELRDPARINVNVFTYAVLY